MRRMQRDIDELTGQVQQQERLLLEAGHGEDALAFGREKLLLQERLDSMEVENARLLEMLDERQGDVQSVRASNDKSARSSGGAAASVSAQVRKFGGLGGGRVKGGGGTTAGLRLVSDEPDAVVSTPRQQ